MELSDLNLLQILLSTLTFLMFFLGSLIVWFEYHLPAVVPESFRYGKFAYNGKPSLFKGIEVPKSWFKHYYVFSSFYSLFIFYFAIDIYLYEAKPSKLLITYLDFLCGSSRKTNCGSLSVLIGLFLFILHSFRRFYETWFVSVFSTSKINIYQYFLAYVHYWVTISTFLTEASGFKSVDSKIIYSSLNSIQIVGIVIFFYACVNQHKSAKILAALRKNSTGNVITTTHKIPRGGYFEYVSSPHFFFEILIYLSLWMVLYNNYTFTYVFIWVLSNQLELSLLNHKWYKETFQNYPKERKALIPFVL